MNQHLPHPEDFLLLIAAERDEILRRRERSAPIDRAAVAPRWWNRRHPATTRPIGPACDA